MAPPRRTPRTARPPRAAAAGAAGAIPLFAAAGGGWGVVGVVTAAAAAFPPARLPPRRPARAAGARDRRPSVAKPAPRARRALWRRRCHHTQLDSRRWWCAAAARRAAVTRGNAAQQAARTASGVRLKKKKKTLRRANIGMRTAHEQTNAQTVLSARTRAGAPGAGADARDADSSGVVTAGPSAPATSYSDVAERHAARPARGPGCAHPRLPALPSQCTARAASRGPHPSCVHSIPVRLRPPAVRRAPVGGIPPRAAGSHEAADQEADDGCEQQVQHGEAAGLPATSARRARLLSSLTWSL